MKASLVKETAWFCLKEASKVARKLGKNPPRQVTFRLFRRKDGERSGRAEVNLSTLRSPKWSHLNRTVWLRMAADVKAKVEVYPRYANMPTCRCYDALEVFVHLVAHELGHAVCGFEGDKTGETQCENFAIRCLDAWRDAMQDPACMI